MVINWLLIILLLVTNYYFLKMLYILSKKNVNVDYLLLPLDVPLKFIQLLNKVKNLEEKEKYSRINLRFYVFFIITLSVLVYEIIFNT